VYQFYNNLRSPKTPGQRRLSRRDRHGRASQSQLPAAPSTDRIDACGRRSINARLILEEDGKIVVTLPDRRLETSDLGDALAAA